MPHRDHVGQRTHLRRGPAPKPIAFGKATLRFAALPFEVALAVSILVSVLEHLRLGVRLVAHALLALGNELANWLELLHAGAA